MKALKEIWEDSGMKKAARRRLFKADKTKLSG
jgi:hypothetical protein